MHHYRLIDILCNISPCIRNHWYYYGVIKIIQYHQNHSIIINAITITVTISIFRIILIISSTIIIVTIIMYIIFMFIISSAYYSNA